MSKYTQKKEKLVKAAIDFGGSSTKIIYENGSGEIRSIVMEPEVSNVPKESVKEWKKNLVGQTEPENKAWIYVPNSDWVQVVGHLAKTMYHANKGLGELKYERGVYKTLAAIWVIKEKLQLCSNFTVALTVLLPPGEFEDKEEFEALLSEKLAKYISPTGQMEIKLKYFKCLPEGAGVYLAHERNIGETLKNKVCGIVMLGYRNASVLVSNKGIVEKGRTSDLGMIRMIERIVEVTSGQDTESLTDAVVKAGRGINEKALQQITRSTTNKGRTSELEKLKRAISMARAEYTAILLSWVDNTLPKETSEIVFCGGTADYLIKELNSHYWKVPLLWNAGVEIPEDVDVSGLGSRLCDIYCAFLYFRDLVEAQAKSRNKSKKNES
ncbi:hypothetical protein RIVM261_076410 [Rivularia sp. IAM M-261]|nr:hypothetical protein RIVM261_076410 [Rivularia sp. IAM M-261]